jgi:hypothetical protein
MRRDSLLEREQTSGRLRVRRRRKFFEFTILIGEKFAQFCFVHDAHSCYDIFGLDCREEWTNRLRAFVLAAPDAMPFSGP